MNQLDLESVRTKATELGIAYHPAQKAETIQAKIDAFLADAPDIIQPPVSAETPQQTEERQLKEATALIPVTIVSMDPQDANVTAVIVSVGNRKLGQISKAIPFNHKWYMPRCLVEELEAKKFCRTGMVPIPGGQERHRTEWLNKYNVVRHPLPTPAELAELAKAQALGNELAK